MINKLKAERKQKYPVINIVCTISKMNYEHLEDMIKVASDIKADTLNYHHLIFTDENVLKKHNKIFKANFGVESTDWEGFVLPDIKNIDVKLLMGNMNNIRKGKYPFLVNFYPNFSKEELVGYYTNPEFVSTSYPKRCLSPWVVAYVYPDGSVLPCHSLGYYAENIKEKPFLEIWNGESLRKFRSCLKKQKYFPVCPKCTEKYRY